MATVNVADILTDFLFGAWLMMVFPVFVHFALAFCRAALHRHSSLGVATPWRPTRRGGSSSGGQESVKIEPYKGPPIFLDEPEKVAVAPTIVTRETIQGETRRRSESSARWLTIRTIALRPTAATRNFIRMAKVFIEGQFRKGRQEGEWKYYFDNGQLNRKSTFKDGKPNGSWEIIAPTAHCKPSAALRMACATANGSRTTTLARSQSAEEHYVAGEEDGVWKTWYPNGQLKAGRF